MDLETASVIADSSVHEIVEDMMDRRGFRQLWESLDEGVRADVLGAWTEIIERKLRAAAYDEGPR